MRHIEVIIVKNRKPIFAVGIIDERCNDKYDRPHTYLYIENGRVCFEADNYISRGRPFDLSDESHAIAKEIFTTTLQADIKTRIMELKQLELIFSDLGLAECLGTSLVDNTKLILDVKKLAAETKKEVKKFTERQQTQGEIKEATKEAIIETVKPIVIAKKKKEDTTDD